MNILGKQLQKMTTLFGESTWFERIALAGTIVAILTTSFDLVCNLNISGYSVRLTLIASLPVVLLGVKALLGGRKSWPVGGLWLLIWVAMQLLMSFRSPSMLNAVGYWCWLVLEVLIVFGLPLLVNAQKRYEWLTWLYLNSFLIIALIGLAQVALASFGVSFFIAQSKHIARANAFTYEPSYLATYLIIGFVIHSYLLEKEDFSLLSKVGLVRNYVAIILAIALTVSRMGYMVVGAWVVFRFAAMIIDMSKQRRRGERVRVPLVFWITLATLAVSVVMVLYSGVGLKEIARGSGLFGTAPHSLRDRVRGLNKCIKVFLESPIVGYGLGGVDPALAAYVSGTYQAGNNGAAMSILGELLVANGIVGLVPFLAYLGSLLVGDAQRRKAPKNERYRTLHLAMVWALVAVFVVLCFNQNILRPYLWMHIAFLSVSWEFFAGTRGSEQSEPGQEPESGQGDKIATSEEAAS